MGWSAGGAIWRDAWCEQRPGGRKDGGWERQRRGFLKGGPRPGQDSRPLTQSLRCGPLPGSGEQGGAESRPSQSWLLWAPLGPRETQAHPSMRLKGRYPTGGPLFRPEMRPEDCGQEEPLRDSYFPTTRHSLQRCQPGPPLLPQLWAQKSLAGALSEAGGFQGRSACLGNPFAKPACGSSLAWRLHYGAWAPSHCTGAEECASQAH